MWPDLDYFATLLVLLQAFLLYGIAVRAEALDGPRLLRAAKAAAKKAAEKRAQRAGERVVPLGAEMDAHRRAKLDRVRAAYAEVGSLSDDYWEPFLVRFLVEANWDEAAAMTKLLEAAPWRRDHGAAAIRRKFAGGFKLGEHPKFVRMLSTVSVLPAHGRATDGDVLSIGHIGHGFEPQLWLDVLSEDDFFDVALHVCEYLSLHADRLSVREGYLVRHCLLLDYDGLSWRHLHPSIFFRIRPLIANLQTYYPELVGSATLVNTPSLFVHLWAIISPWLSPAVRQRVSTVEPAERSETLAGLVPPANLPKAFGGQCAEVPEDVRRALGLNARACKLRGIYNS